ncbi:hypothetical protein ACFVP3_38455 [Streptomyces sp. NPDC057806]|uniref:hypothetical protein n=1 Tax=unclassified Streptomyces TaxID=2593676 RepID=UPI0036CC7E54
MTSHWAESVKQARQVSGYTNAYRAARQRRRLPRRLFFAAGPRAAFAAFGARR